MRRGVSLFVLVMCCAVMFSCEKNPLPDVKLRETYRSPALFEILGYLDDYSGRRINSEDEDVVDSFYLSQKEAADKFEKLLHDFKKEFNLQTEIVRKDYEHHIYFYSKEIADIVNSSYVLEYEEKAAEPPEWGEDVKDSDWKPMYRCQLDVKFVQEAFTTEKLAYLRGAYSRYGEKNSFRFANSVTKFNLIISILRYLDCIEVKTMSLVSRIPNSNIIVFYPSRIVRESLGIESYVDIVMQDVKKEDIPEWKLEGGEGMMRMLLEKK